MVDAITLGLEGKLKSKGTIDIRDTVKHSEYIFIKRVNMKKH